MKPLIPARWSTPAATLLALALGGVEGYVTMPHWGHYVVGVVVVVAGALGIEAPGSVAQQARTDGESWPK